ncbi:MAG: hypothetical protein JEY99_13730 [Spirochaetales bacterium]|nr:hypothetical protein [Spirochaetales bacterium]
MTPKNNFFHLLENKSIDSIPFMPITMMFAADLIEVPYREYATNAAIQCRGQLKVAETFGTTHVSAISDPAVEASDLGASVLIPENAPQAIFEDEALLKNKGRLSTLRIILPENGRRMANRLKVLESLKKSRGDLIVEGWVEGPCAEAADLRGINRLMLDFFDDPPFVEALMDFITAQEILFAKRQIEAGADIIGIGDAASSLIGPDLYRTIVLPRMKRYVDSIHDSGGLVRLHICGNINPLYPLIAELNVDMIDLDSMCSISNARKILGDRPAIAGNIDPVKDLKDGSPEEIKERLQACRMEAVTKYIIGAGCEVPRGTPFQNLKTMGKFRTA